MSYTADRFARASWRKIAGFILWGVESGSRNMDHEVRLNEDMERVQVLAKTMVSDPQELDRLISQVNCLCGTYEEVYLEIGLRMGMELSRGGTL